MEEILCFLAGSPILAALFAPLAMAHGSPEKPTVRIIATGGTIAMKIDPVKKGPVPAVSGEDLVAAVPQINQLARIEVENFSNISSVLPQLEMECSAV